MSTAVELPSSYAARPFDRQPSPVLMTPRRWLRPTVAMRSLAFIEVRASINVHIVRLGGYDIVPAQAGLSFEPSSVKVEVTGADATAPSIVRKPSSRQKNVTRFSLFRRREKRGKRKTRALLVMRGAEYGRACGPDHGPSPAVQWFRRVLSYR